jgi:putative exporter of polyketide antibiotics
MRRVLADARVRTIAFACLFAVVACIQPVTYRNAYPTLPSRLAFAHSFGASKAVVLFYGKAYDLLTVGGYSAWRVGGTLADHLRRYFELIESLIARHQPEDTTVAATASATLHE